MSSEEHPVFARVRAMPARWRSHFPKSPEEARAWTPQVDYRALSSRVLVVWRTRVEGTWAAYCDAVPGKDFDRETEAVLREGDKVDEATARAIFPQFEGVPYAR